MTLRPNDIPQLAVFAIIGLTMAGCGGNQDTQRAVAIVVSGDTAGWIVPCGCASNQSGGLPRRGSFIKRVADDGDVLYLDAGGAPGATSAYDQLKFRFILQGERDMGLAAHNVGAGELALGVETLRRIARELNVVLLSTNAVDAGGKPIGRPYVFGERAGRRILVVGVISQSFSVPDVSITSPRRSILDVLNQTTGQRDYTVVLAYVPEPELRELAANLPEVDLIVGGPTGQAISPVQQGPTMLAAATNKGKFLIRVDLPPAGASQPPTSTVVEMDESWEDEPGQTANIENFRTELAKADFAPADTVFAPTLPTELPAEYRVAGSRACRECHAADCTVWDASGHAHAWATLQETGAHVDPYCQQCHTTGYGLPGGFVSAGTPSERTDVGCESCHGPSQGHADKSDVHTAYYEQARNHCLKCHDHDNSPEFDYAIYWPRIEHGQDTDENSEAGPTREPARLPEFDVR